MSKLIVDRERLLGTTLLLCLCFILLIPYAHAGGSVSVRGYIRANGTYVAPHMRSAPDASFSNNWSTVGNVNPYTSKIGTNITPPLGTSNPGYGIYTVPANNSGTTSIDLTTDPTKTIESETKSLGRLPPYTRKNGTIGSHPLGTSSTGYGIHTAPAINSETISTGLVTDPNKTVKSGRNLGLNTSERQSLESACVMDKMKGPAAYNQCLTSQLKAFNAGPKQPDLRTLNTSEHQSIESACVMDKMNGPAAYNQCLTSQLKAFNAGPKQPDLRTLNTSEH
ncbi:hypothetical protein ACIQUS_09765, partial [Pseudomonas sp. NPDC090755]